LPFGQLDYCWRVSGPFPVDSFESCSIAGEYTVLVFPIVFVQRSMERFIVYIFDQIQEILLIRKDQGRQEEKDEE
jgi:hypothetical protein